MRVLTLILVTLALTLSACGEDKQQRPIHGVDYDRPDPNYSSIDQYNERAFQDEEYRTPPNTQYERARSRNRQRHNDSLWDGFSKLWGD